MRAVGVGLAGYLDLGGTVRVSPNAPGLVGIDLRTRLADKVGLPVTTENDANCVAIAANHLLAPASGDLVAVTLGTGIGGGIVVDGELVRGAHGFAAEPGHTVIDPSGPRCPCGQRGCWERFASGSGLRYLARRAAEAGNADAVRRRAGSLDAIRGELITTMVAEGDRGAVAIFDEFIRYLTIGVANLINIIDPEVIVLGGGLIETGDRLVDGVRTELRANYPTTTARRATCGSRRRREAPTPEASERGWSPPEWSSGVPTARVSLHGWSSAGSRRCRPYVFTIIDGLKVEARRAGEDIIDLGFGNPDLPSPDIAVEKLSEAAHNTRNHRYSASRGLPEAARSGGRPTTSAASASTSTPTPR